MLLDLHMHEATYSCDSSLKLSQIVRIAKQRGLDGICITDHDSMGLKEIAAAYTIETGFPIIVGVEFNSLDGDIVAFGLDELPKERIPAQDFINIVKHAGGIAISAHPFRNNGRGLADKLYEIEGLNGVEVLNGSTLAEENQQALNVCRSLGLQPVGASDCHIPEKVGVYATFVPGNVSTVEELIRAFRRGGLHAVAYRDGVYDLLS